MKHPDERREKAAVLFEAGATQAEVARRLGIARSTCSVWYRAWSAGRLLTLPDIGRPAEVPEAVLTRLGRALLDPPGAQGLPGEAWTVDLVVHWIETQSGVRYHRGHIPRLIRRMGWLVSPMRRDGVPGRLRVLASDVGPVHFQFVSPRRP